MIIISSLRRSSLTCKHGKIFLFSSHKNEIGVLLLLHLISDRNPHIFNCRKIGRGGKNLVASCPGVAFATPCHPMATGLDHAFPQFSQAGPDEWYFEELEPDKPSEI